MTILSDTKQSLGISKSDTDFDLNILIMINAALAHLHDLGVFQFRPPEITSDQDGWETVTIDSSYLPILKNYVYLKVRQMFDPPQTSFGLSSLDNLVKEHEWRLHKEFDKS